MNFYNKQEAIIQMNEWGASRQPFVFIIDFKQEQIFLEIPDKVDSKQIKYNFNGFSNSPFINDEHFNEAYKWDIFPVPIEVYKKSFDNVISHLLAGNSYLVNLTCSTPIETELSLETIYKYAKAPYKLLCKDNFVVFSPEIFIKTEGRFMYAYPMKGTIDATIPNASQCVMDDKKEAAEHATIVDLIRNDLSMVATDVTVTRYRYIEEIETSHGGLLQVSSEIRGKLPEAWLDKPGDVLFPLLPAGSITGAPKKKTLQIIEESEEQPRGFYTGVMGYYDGQHLESAVMIRFIEKRENHYFYRSGGGITAQSDMQHEYNEVLQKVYVPFR